MIDYRMEYPRPQFVRSNWENLNGKWQFEIDNGRSGIPRGLAEVGRELSETINVPYCPESELSGINNKDFMYGVWYKKKVNIKAGGNKTILHIGAADYHTFLFVNAEKVGEHKGGYVSFAFDITKYVTDGENEIAVYCEDDTRDMLIPSGKQSDRYNSYSCSYTRTTGIWQTVWLEYVPNDYIKNVKFFPNISEPSVTLSFELCGKADLTAEVYYDGELCGKTEIKDAEGAPTTSIRLSRKELWELGNGRLYDVKLRFGDDSVSSYFGLREVSVHEGFFFLNGKKIFQRLILDQGFYPDGIYTAPSDAALENDIKLTMDLGFNGARLHEKIFEERFLYHADKLGYIVWGEYPDWGLDISDPMNVYSVLPEWLEEVRRDFNHPAIIGWCPHNETWDVNGRKQYDDSLRVMYEVTKSLDSTRPCIDTSGNFHVVTDIYDLHDYTQDPAEFAEHYKDVANMDHSYAHNSRQKYSGGAVFMSEFGGIAWDLDEKGWGYGNGPKTKEEFMSRFKGLIDSLLDNPMISGFCYTQLTNVEQEQNGLYTYSRVPKFDVEEIRKIVSRKAVIED